MNINSLLYLRDTPVEDPFLIGKEVVKKSGKPFKSGREIATVKGYTKNERTGHLSFTFIEDDSDVECYRCELF